MASKPPAVPSPPKSAPTPSPAPKKSPTPASKRAQNKKKSVVTFGGVFQPLFAWVERKFEGFKCRRRGFSLDIMMPVVVWGYFCLFMVLIIIGFQYFRRREEERQDEVRGRTSKGRTEAGGQAAS